MSVNKLLDPEEVADGGMDERALALYTSLFYHAYKAKGEMEKMQAALGQNAFQLELEHKGKEELIRMNIDLNETLTKAKAELATVQESSETSHRELVEARERIEELERMLAAQEQERVELKQALADLEASRNAEIVKRQAAEEVVRTQDQQLEATHELCEEERAKHEKAQAHLAQLQADLDKANERLRIETAAKEGGVRDLTEKLSTETQRAKDLAEKHAAEVAHTEELSTEVSELKARLKKEQKANVTREKQLAESREQTRLNTSGLAVLRTNLDSHISDLHRWQKFLEGRVADVQDPTEELERLQEELEKLSFQEQLNLLSSHLQEENVAMTRILKERAKEKEGKSAPAASSEGTKKKRKHKERSAAATAATTETSPTTSPATTPAPAPATVPEETPKP
jgi:cortexillin 1/2